jgi:hypothetical protein
MNNISRYNQIEIIPPLSDVSSAEVQTWEGIPIDENFFNTETSDFVPLGTLDSEPVTTTINKYQECPNPARGIKFLHTPTGRSCDIPCNKYSCPVCGKKKAKILYKAIHTWLMQFDKIRMWTLTLSGSVVQDNYEHYKILQECWRRFITEIRRNKYLSEKQRNIQYVRVAELHEGHHSSNSEVKNIGKVHFHVFVTEYIEVKFVQSIWNHILQELTGQQCKVGNVNMMMIPNAEVAAHYVTNYVLKSAKLLEAKQKKWTKSGKVSIMTKRISSGEWMIINMSIPLEDNFLEAAPASYYNFKNISVTSQNYQGLSPPITPNIQIALFKNDESRQIYKAMTE